MGGYGVKEPLKKFRTGPEPDRTDEGLTGRTDRKSRFGPVTSRTEQPDITALSGENRNGPKPVPPGSVATLSGYVVIVDAYGYMWFVSSAICQAFQDVMNVFFAGLPMEFYSLICSLSSSLESNSLSELIFSPTSTNIFKYISRNHPGFDEDQKELYKKCPLVQKLELLARISPCLLHTLPRSGEPIQVPEYFLCVTTVLLSTDTSPVAKHCHHLQRRVSSLPKIDYYKKLSVPKGNTTRFPWCLNRNTKVSSLSMNDYYKKPSVPEEGTYYNVPSVPKQEYNVPFLSKNDYYKKPSILEDNYKKVSPVSKSNYYKVLLVPKQE
ncbi:hypothetical protein H5410_039574 [Solanum commersonii]|uniref:Uncharacterized protein n=1 Tax=Solanum commersonii TaxID=4109 RepID=A0A9J5XNZ3_SOLCO|nr:hypothetical protein H5410_039574 [Solanum commersonii]